MKETEGLPVFVVNVPDPVLHRALSDLVRGLDLGSVQISANADSPDLTVEEIESPVRLGALLDWVFLRSSDSVKKPPAQINLPTGIFYPSRCTFRRTEERTDIFLSAREADLLLSLALAPGQTLTRGQILKEIWGYAEGLETHTLETHIYRLRKKIELDPTNPTIVVTTVGGYALVL